MTSYAAVAVGPWYAGRVVAWDRLTNKNCSDLVRSLVHEEGETDLGLVCEEVIETALELDSRDNMTCCVVMFPGANMARQVSDMSSLSSSISSVSSSASGVLKRRIERQASWGRDSTPAKRAHLRLEERRRKQRELLAQQKGKGSKLQVVRGRQPGPTAAAASASGAAAKKHKAATSLSGSGRARGNKITRIQGTSRQ